ncbi:MAG: hypothetical protein KDJ87_16770 [Rhizobiaceae bacterium]|nr:hypothetical protein [Rhizobiaceae bacterium]
MSKTIMTTAALAILAVSSLAGIATAAQLKAATTVTRAANMTCTIPNNVSCKITSRKGIKSVLIKAGAAQGNVPLVSKTYAGCPTLVTVTWDSAYQMGSKQIVECTPMGIKAN